MTRLDDNNKLALLIGPAVVLAAVVIVDQITKAWAMGGLTPGQSVEVWGRFFMFTLVFNDGGAMGTNFGSSTYYLVSSLLILAFIIYYAVVNRHLPRITYPLGLIAGGAIGNIIDRIRIGQVIDFIDFDFFDIHIWNFHLERWWTWNIADAAISCSIVFLIFSLFHHRHDHQVAAEASEPDRVEST